MTLACTNSKMSLYSKLVTHAQSVCVCVYGQLCVDIKIIIIVIMIFYVIHLLCVPSGRVGMAVFILYFCVVY